MGFLVDLAILLLVVVPLPFVVVLGTPFFLFWPQAEETVGYWRQVGKRYKRAILFFWYWVGRTVNEDGVVGLIFDPRRAPQDQRCASEVSVTRDWHPLAPDRGERSVSRVSRRRLRPDRANSRAHAWRAPRQSVAADPA